jgi:hypothetical protein
MNYAQAMLLLKNGLSVTRDFWCSDPRFLSWLERPHGTTLFCAYRPIIQGIDHYSPSRTEWNDADPNRSEDFLGRNANDWRRFDDTEWRALRDRVLGQGVRSQLKHRE